MEEAQLEEIQALRAIYDQAFNVLSEAGKEYMIEIKTGDFAQKPQSIILEFLYPPDYPLTSPPVFKLRCSMLTSEETCVLATQLVEIYNPGEVVMFQWVEYLREFLAEKFEASNNFSDSVNDGAVTKDNHSGIDDAEAPNKSSSDVQPSSHKSELCPIIHHGEALTDRKSTFQAHVAEATTVEQVGIVLHELKSNKKIATATHNIMAYRIYDATRQVLIQDCDDDGESAAGSRLLHLLQIMKLENVVVVVTRWYGGIHLGPDRFKHINNCARILLQEQNFGKSLPKETKSKRKSKKKSN